MDFLYTDAFTLRGTYTVFSFILVLVGVLAFMKQKHPHLFDRIGRFFNEYVFYIVIAFLLLLATAVVVTYEAQEFGYCFFYIACTVALLVAYLTPNSSPKRLSVIPSLPEPVQRNALHQLLVTNARFEHTHVLGAPGSGKTELLKYLIKQDTETNAAVIVMAPKGNLIRSLSRLAMIDSDRLIIIEPDGNLALNLFDLGDTARAVSLITYVFESLLESDPTPKQKAFLNLSIKQVKNLTEFRAFLKQKHDKLYAETAEQLQWRLDLLLSNPLIEQMFSHPKTLINVNEVMATGKVLLIDTSIRTLGELGSSFFGRYFVALIALAAEQRDTERRLRPVYVYIDEASTYLTDYIESILDRARETKVGLTLAHQHLKQLTDISAKLEASVQNTAIKFIGRCNDHDSRRMAAEMGLEPETLKNQPPLSFWVAARNATFQYSVTVGYLDSLPKRTDREMAQFMAKNRERVCSYQLRRVAEPQAQYTDPGTDSSME